MSIFRLKILCVLGLPGDKKDESKDNTESYRPPATTLSPVRSWRCGAH